LPPARVSFTGADRASPTGTPGAHRPWWVHVQRAAEVAPPFHPRCCGGSFPDKEGRCTRCERTRGGAVPLHLRPLPTHLDDRLRRATRRGRAWPRLRLLLTQRRTGHRTHRPGRLPVPGLRRQPNPGPPHRPPRHPPRPRPRRRRRHDLATAGRHRRATNHQTPSTPTTRPATLALFSRTTTSVRSKEVVLAPTALVDADRIDRGVRHAREQPGAVLPHRGNTAGIVYVIVLFATGFNRTVVVIGALVLALVAVAGSALRVPGIGRQRNRYRG